MTVVVHIGRRVPRGWFKRTATKAKGLLSFQENIWLIIKQSMSMAKKKANASGKIKFVITNDNEIEDLNYMIEWMVIIIQGNEEQEKEEYEEANEMYSTLGTLFKKDMPKDERLQKHFKTKILNSSKVEEAYQKGYGASKGSSIADKMLEMGILTHVEWNKDFDSREVDFTPDF